MKQHAAAVSIYRFGGGKRLAFLFVGVFLFFGMRAVSAAPDVAIRDAGYAAQYVAQSAADPVTIEQGQTRDIVFTFKNTGTAAWDGSGGRYISAYTMEPRYRDSAFAADNWESSRQTASIKGIVAPGKTGELHLTLTAREDPGEYIERFYLAAENYTWVKGGYFYVKVRVVPKTETQALSETEKPASNSGYKGKTIGLNTPSVSVSGGERVKLVVIYQNIGETPWPSYSLVASSPGGVAGTSASFADADWKDASVVVERQTEVPPGRSLRETFYLRAPAEKGAYTARFYVQTDGTVLDTPITINVHVTENAPVNYVPPVFSNKADVSFRDPAAPRLSEEPRIRVGIQSLDDTQERALHIVSYDDDYRILNGTTAEGVLGKTYIAVIQYAGGVYSFKGNGVSFRTNEPIRLEPVSNPHAVFTLMNVDRSMSWAGPGKFNTYRGALEYRRGEVDGEMYIVNDLLLEDYVKGIRETGTTAPIEMVKANLVAARTYAYISKGKYPLFDVLGSTYDQLYLGVQSESVGGVTQAVEATRGVMVTYKGEIVTTPYFGNSNGWTKSWSSVWGGVNKPWLVPVKAEYDAGRRQFGHGVGMSQRDAALRAEKEGATWQELVTHYYTGVELERIFN